MQKIFKSTLNFKSIDHITDTRFIKKGEADMSAAVKKPFATENKQILSLVINSLYQNKEVFFLPAVRTGLAAQWRASPNTSK